MSTPNPVTMLRPQAAQWRFWFAALAAACCSHAPVALSAQADATTATYGDWVLQCRPSATPPAAPACELLQTLVADGQRPVARLAIARLAPQSPLMLAVELPTYVSFAQGVRVSSASAAGAEQGVTLTWRRCLPSGCFADANLSDDLLGLWRQQQGGQLTFQDGADKPVVLPMSFRGLADALQALARN